MAIRLLIFGLATVNAQTIYYLVEEGDSFETTVEVDWRVWHDGEL